MKKRALKFSIAMFSMLSFLIVSFCAFATELTVPISKSSVSNQEGDIKIQTADGLNPAPEEIVYYGVAWR